MLNSTMNEAIQSYNFVPFHFVSTFSSQVRKSAHQGVCSILRGSDFLFTDNAPAHHPAAATTAKFCIKEMEHAGGKILWSSTYFTEASVHTTPVFTDLFLL